MTQTYSTDCTEYSTETIANQLATLGLPFTDLLARALTALLSGRKATLHQIATLLPGPQQAQSTEAKRQQLRRLLDHPALTPQRWARAVASLLPKSKWVLALDRTQWKVGNKPVNLLVLAVVHAGCAVPILWNVLDKPGASDTHERKQLLQRFLALFGTQALRFLSADREFIGRDWIAWLLSEKVPFRIRIKAGEWLRHEDGRQRRASDWFALRACACKKRRFWLWGLPVFVGGIRDALARRKRLQRAEQSFLVVISNAYQDDVLAEYRLRWKVETLFQALKGRGFDMEASRLIEAHRLSAFFGLLWLALCWCLKVGAFVRQVAPLPLKKHGRAPLSTFGRGLARLQTLLAPLAGTPCHACFVQTVGLLCPA